jgi:hypothetical protein
MEDMEPGAEFCGKLERVEKRDIGIIGKIRTEQYIGVFRHGFLLSSNELSFILFPDAQPA